MGYEYGISTANHRARYLGQHKPSRSNNPDYNEFDVRSTPVIGRPSPAATNSCMHLLWDDPSCPRYLERKASIGVGY